LGLRRRCSRKMVGFDWDVGMDLGLVGGRNRGGE